MTSYPQIFIKLLFIFTFLTPVAHASTPLKVGDMAPIFQLYDQNNQLQSLENYHGKWVVLYFYPKNDTPGCTEEACNFRDDYIGIRREQAYILGVNIDSEKSHQAFSKKHGLPFSLLADLDGETAKNYGAVWKLGPIMLTKRQTFIINPEGKIAKIYRKVDTKSHSKEIISALKELREIGRN